MDFSLFLMGPESIFSNSLWSARVIQKKYGYPCNGNIYPPVSAKFKEVPWREKKGSFVSIGRIVPEKRIEHQVEILFKVRELGHDLDFPLDGRCWR